MSTKNTPEAAQIQVEYIRYQIEELLYGLTYEEMQVLIMNRDLYRGTFKEMTDAFLSKLGNMAIRTVTVNRDRTPREMLNATRCDRKEGAKAVLAKIPRGGSGIQKGVVVKFFKRDHWLSPQELTRAYEEEGIDPDPYAVAAVSEVDPWFADGFPYVVQWKDADDYWYSLSFYGDHGERCVSVCRSNDSWPGSSWLFGGVPKKTAPDPRALCPDGSSAPGSTDDERT